MTCFVCGKDVVEVSIKPEGEMKVYDFCSWECYVIWSERVTGKGMHTQSQHFTSK